MTLQKLKDELADLKAIVSSFITSKTNPTAEQMTGLESRLGAAETKLTSQLAEKDKDISDRDATIKDLQGKLETAQNEVNAKGKEIKTLQGQVETEKQRANKVLAAQGIDLASLPAGETTADAGTVETDFAKYNRLLATDARAAGEFWSTHSVKILASRPKS
jgi:chromosome segregation ATPase